MSVSGGYQGRAGNTGNATAFVNDRDSHLMRDLVVLLREANQDVPKWLEGMATAGGNMYRSGGKGMRAYAGRPQGSDCPRLTNSELIYLRRNCCATHVDNSIFLTVRQDDLCEHTRNLQVGAAAPRGTIVTRTAAAAGRVGRAAAAAAAGLVRPATTSLRAAVFLVEGLGAAEAAEAEAAVAAAVRRQSPSRVSNPSLV